MCSCIQVYGINKGMYNVIDTVSQPVRENTFVWISYCILLIDGAVSTLGYAAGLGVRYSWDDAMSYCQTIHNGTISTYSDIQNSNHTIRDDVWINTSQLTPWLSIQGCYKVRKSKRWNIIEFDSDATKRCSEMCHKQFIGIHNSRWCVCLSKTHNKMHRNWNDCVIPTKKSRYIIYRKYDNSELYNESASESDLFDSSLSCGTVKCERTGYFYPKHCTHTDLFRVRCDRAERSKKKLTWEKGQEHCLSKKEQHVQSFEKYCENENGEFSENDTGEFWIGMFRPLGKDQLPYRECTYHTRNKKLSVSCSRQLHFFCTGADGLVYLPSTGNTGSHVGNDFYQYVLLAVIAVLVFLLAVIFVFVMILRRRTKQYKQYLRSQQYIMTVADTSTNKLCNKDLQQREQDQEDIYEFAEIEPDGDSNICSRNLGLKCPLPPDRPSSAVKSMECNTKVTDSPTNYITEQKIIKDQVNNYDSFITARADNSIESDFYDHAKIVAVKNSKTKVDDVNLGNGPPKPCVHEDARRDSSQGVYDLAKAVENEYDEMGAPAIDCTLTDTYDHVTTISC